MHGCCGQRLEGHGVDARQIGTIAQPVDGAMHFLRSARLFFVQCHASVTATEVSFLSRTVNTVVFSHGKESGPWGAKISAMAAVVRDLGLAVDSIDYRGIEDPGQRVEKLVTAGAALNGPLVLVGSSMGGHVAAAAVSRLHVK